MSEKSHNLQLPYILPSQAQKHVTHNEAVRMLDAILYLSVASVRTDDPPAEPQEGERHIVGASAGGEWRQHANRIAAFADGAWQFFKPVEGWIAWNRQEENLLVFAGGEWLPLANEREQVELLGINGAASTQQRLLVQSENILFNHDGGDHRLKLNKAELTDTASIVFQTGYSGRAEFGLAGEDKFSVKVSPDGSQWKTALRIDPQDGAVDLPCNGVFSGLNLLPDSGRFVGSTRQHVFTARTAVPPRYLGTTNGSAFSFPFRFINNSSSYGGSNAALSPVVQQLVTKIFGEAGLLKGPEFHVLQIVAGSGRAGSLTIGEEQFFRQTLAPTSPRPSRFTTGFYVRSERGKTALRAPQGKVHGFWRDGREVSHSSASAVVVPADGWVYFEMQLHRTESFQEAHDLSLYLLPESTTHFALPRVVAGWVTLGPAYGMLLNDQMFQG